MGSRRTGISWALGNSVMTVGFDIDGTLTDFYRFVAEHGRGYLRRKGIEPAVDPKGYDLDGYFGLEAHFRLAGIPDGHARQKSGELLKGFWNAAYLAYLREPFIPGPAAAVRGLYRAGHRILIVSSRRGAADRGLRGRFIRGSIRWQFRHNSVPFHELVLAGDDGQKEAAIRRLAPDLFVEDKRHLIKSLSSFTHCVALERPYNSPLEGSRGCTVCGNDADLEALLRGLTKRLKT